MEPPVSGGGGALVVRLYSLADEGGRRLRRVRIQVDELEIPYMLLTMLTQTWNVGP